MLSIERNAVLSGDGLYRYSLTRTWDRSLPTVVFVMHNPSTADANVDDPTIRRIESFARAWGYGQVAVVNLYAIRSPDPKIIRYVSNPTGCPQNQQHIKELLTRENPSMIVYAWGNQKPEPDWLHALVKEPYCLGVSLRGNVPKHPLYLRKSTLPQRYQRTNGHKN